MPPYQNESLHDMHALMQQLDTLNVKHDTEHAPEPSSWLPDLGITKTLKKAGKAAADQYDKTFGPTDAENQWKAYATTEPKIIVFENTFNDIIAAMRHNGAGEWTPANYDALKNNIQSNKQAKLLFEANITANPQFRARVERITNTRS
jgi:hypothetical protein